MAGNTVELSVRSKLLQIVEELNQISDASKKSAESLQQFANQTANNVENQSQKTSTFLGRLRGLAGRVAKGMSDDFKALFNITRLTEGLKLSGVFRQNIAETIELANQIRKLGQIFGIAEDRFVSFQTKITQGLGEIGLSSQVATNSLKGLSETQVRGEDALLEYSKLAGQLSSLTQTQGSEAELAKGMANVIVQRGGDSSNIGQVRQLAQMLKQAFIATGKDPRQLLAELNAIFESMPQDLRKALDFKTMLGVMIPSAVAGPNAAKFLQEYLAKSKTERLPIEQRKFFNLFTKDGGFNIDQFRKGAKNVFSNYQQDPRLMAQTLGLSQEAAEGFVRLYESLDKIDDAQQRAIRDNKSLEQAYYSAMTASEAFLASLNKFKASFAEPIAELTNFSTNVLKKAFKFKLDDLIDVILPEDMAKSVKAEKAGHWDMPKAFDENLGSTAVVAGGGLLAAVLAGGGLKGLLKLGRGKAEGVAERLAYEQLTGAKVQDVYVVNAGEIGSQVSGKSGGAMGFGEGALGWLAKFALVGGAGYAGFKAGEEINAGLEGTEIEKLLNAPFIGAADAVEKFQFAITELISAIQGKKPAAWNVPKMTEVRYYPKGVDPSQQMPGTNPFQPRNDIRVIVETKSKDIKASTEPNRGGSQL